MNTAVLFLVFNRFDTTKEVFNAIKEAKPPRLYIASDGARDTKKDELKVVKEIRTYILEYIDWECEVKTLFRDTNLGCRLSVSGAIDWFFESEEMGIILEDDCLPSQSFFLFCEKMLLKYKDDKKVSLITGTSYLFNEIDSKDTYFFSRYISIWGWATWRRVWTQYDSSMQKWISYKKQKRLQEILYWDKYIELFFENVFDKGYNNTVDAWSSQFVFQCLCQDSYCLTPYKNLISNIGIEGTRSSDNSPFINMKSIDIDIENMSLDVPVEHNIEIDKQLFENVFYRFEKFGKLKMIVKYYLKKIFNIVR